MNNNEIKTFLKRDYNCQCISVFKYGGYEIAKGIDSSKEGIKYRYFRIVNGSINEISDKILLDELKREFETNSEIVY